MHICTHAKVKGYLWPRGSEKNQVTLEFKFAPFPLQTVPYSSSLQPFKPNPPDYIQMETDRLELPHTALSPQLC